MAAGGAGGRAQLSAVLDAGALAEVLQRSSELAAEYGISPGSAAAGSESALFGAALQLHAARSRAMGAAGMSELAGRLHQAPSARALLLRGFATLSPRLAALAGAHAQDADRCAAAAPRAVRTADATAQMEAIAEWCRARLAAGPEARLLVIFPGSAGQRERLAALIRSVLDPGCGARRGVAQRRVPSASKAASRSARCRCPRTPCSASPSLRAPRSIRPC